MAEFSNIEIQNELSRFIRGSIQPSQDGGQNDPQVIHSQLLELARTVFFLNPGAIYHLALIVRNSLRDVLNQEIVIVEDMLIAIDDVVRVRGGKIASIGPVELRNASTSASSLESARPVRGRPEINRFRRQIDCFTQALRGSIVDGKPSFRLQSGEARDALRDNLARLKDLHQDLLSLIINLTSLLDSYAALDIPSQVSSTTMIRVREELTALADEIETLSEEEVNKNSRLYFLRTVASKVVVDLLDQFIEPELDDPIITSEIEGDVYLLRPTGKGEPATAVSGPGPWLITDLSQDSMTFVVDGGDPQVVDLSDIKGPGIHGETEGPWPDSILFPNWPGPSAPGGPLPPPKEDYEPKNEFHIVVDSRSYEFTSERWGYLLNDGTPVMEGIDTVDGVAPAPALSPPPNNIPDNPPVNSQGGLSAPYWTTVQMQPPRKLGFKHLGTGLYVELPTVKESTSAFAHIGAGFGSWSIGSSTQNTNPEAWSTPETERYPYVLQPRIITELRLLKNVAVTISGDTITGPSGSFEENYVGFYIRVGSFPNHERYEIVEYISDTQVRVDFRGDAVSDQTVGVFGQGGEYTQITFGPDLLVHTRNVGVFLGPHNVRDTAKIIVSPSIKTASIPQGLAGGGTIAEITNALSNEANGSQGTNKYAHASYHATFQEQPGYNNKLTIRNRSNFLPSEFGLSPQFFKYEATLNAAANPDIRSGSTLKFLGKFGDQVFLTGLTGVTHLDRGSVLVISGADSSANNGSFSIVSPVYEGAVRVNNWYADVVPVVSYDRSRTYYAETAVITNVDADIADLNDGSINFVVRDIATEFPIPNREVKIIKNSAASVFGFSDSQTAVVEEGVYLKLDELAALITDGVEGVNVKIEEDLIRTGTVYFQANTSQVIGIGTTFDEISPGSILEIQEGQEAGRYIIESASGSTLNLILPAGRNYRGFIGNTKAAQFKIFTQKIRVTSTNEERGSAIRIISAPSTLGFPIDTALYGKIDWVEAVNAKGETLVFDKVSPGDKINEAVVLEVSSDKRSVRLEGGTSSEDIAVRFRATSSTKEQLKIMLENLDSIFSSANLLAANGFNSSLNALDVALTSVISPGASLQANVNTAKTLLANLHSILTSEVRSAEEFETKIPTAALNIEDSISSYDSDRVPALNSLLDALEDQEYDRALFLLSRGDLTGFFSTNSENASFSGALLESARIAVGDLQAQSRLDSRVRERIIGATGRVILTDPERDFSDTEGEEIDEL